MACRWLAVRLRLPAILSPYIGSFNLPITSPVFLRHIPGSFLIFCAFGLLLIASVSCPIWDNVYFLRADLATTNNKIHSNSSGYLRVGNWGACYGGSCTGKHYGFKFNTFLPSDAGSSLSIINGLTYTLILHPIACFIAFVALILSLIPTFFTGLLAMFAISLGVLVTGVALILDLILFILARHELNNQANTHANLGNGIWIVVAAFICLVISVCTVALSRVKRAVHHKDNEYAQDPEKTTQSGWFGRKNRNTVNTYDTQDNGYAGETYATQPSNYGESHSFQPQPDSVHTEQPLIEEEAPAVAQDTQKSHFWEKKAENTAY